MADYAQSSLAAAVKAEASNWQAVGGLYGQTAKELSALFTESGNAQVHLYMVAAQDLTGDPLVWNRAMSGLKKALSALPAPLVFTATRDFRHTHRAKNPLFEIATKASVDATKQAAAKEQEEKAAAIEKAAAEERAQAKAAQDLADETAYLATTADDLAADVLEHCGKLRIAPEDIARLILKTLNSDDLGTFMAGFMRTLSPAQCTDLIGVEPGTPTTVKIAKAPIAKAA